MLTISIHLIPNYTWFVTMKASYSCYYWLITELCNKPVFFPQPVPNCLQMFLVLYMILSLISYLIMLWNTQSKHLSMVH